MANRRESPFEQIGGMETCRRISARFHEKVAADGLLRELFPRDMAATEVWLALFIAEQLGGPADYKAKRGKQSLICRHAHIRIGSAETGRWLELMYASIDEIGIQDPARQWLRDYFGKTAPTLMDPFIELYHLPLQELKALLEREPNQATASHMGRSLLGEAARRWDAARVQMLLEHGANPSAAVALERDPLYEATNGKGPSPAMGRAVVELLLQHGADANRPSGPGRSTPLHMTSRRGNVLLAEALLDAGANIESRDSKGETPLRRAVNCRQPQMVEFLLTRGANPSARDKEGRTALDATKHAAIREALTGRRRQAN